MRESEIEGRKREQTMKCGQRFLFLQREKKEIKMWGE